MHTQQARGQLLRDLHLAAKTFLMPNAWDGGSARMLASHGFPAIATTSAGIAFSLGLPDYAGAVPRADMLDCIGRVVRSVSLPVSADLEAGYGVEPAQVAETIALAIATGAVGGNIEDYTGNAAAPLFDAALAAERIRAARAAADKSGIPFTLTGRTDCYLAGVDQPFAQAVRRANLYREAGADCLFVPGAADPKAIAELVKEIDGPLTVVMGLKGASLTVAQLEDLGVRRITIGGSLARATYGLIRQPPKRWRWPARSTTPAGRFRTPSCARFSRAIRIHCHRINCPPASHLCVAASVRRLAHAAVQNTLFDLPHARLFGRKNEEAE